jgi:hypothetical protein
MTDICPVCREPIRRGAIYTPLSPAQGRTRVMQVRHRKSDGRVCVAYLGERRGQGAVGRATGDYRAPVFAAVAALARRSG